MSSVGLFLSRVPWWAYVAALVLITALGSYYSGRKDERAHWVAKMEAAEAQARENAELARQVADERLKQEAEEFEAQQDILREVIEDAEETSTNPLDALFGSMPEAD